MAAAMDGRMTQAVYVVKGRSNEEERMRFVGLEETRMAEAENEKRKIKSES